MSNLPLVETMNRPEFQRLSAVLRQPMRNWIIHRENRNIPFETWIEDLQKAVLISDKKTIVTVFGNIVSEIAMLPISKKATTADVEWFTSLLDLPDDQSAAAIMLLLAYSSAKDTKESQ